MFASAYFWCIHCRTRRYISSNSNSECIVGMEITVTGAWYLQFSIVLIAILRHFSKYILTFECNHYELQSRQFCGMLSPQYCPSKVLTGAERLLHMSLSRSHCAWGRDILSSQSLLIKSIKLNKAATEADKPQPYRIIYRTCRDSDSDFIRHRVIYNEDACVWKEHTPLTIKTCHYIFHYNSHIFMDFYTLYIPFYTVINTLYRTGIKFTTSP